MKIRPLGGRVLIKPDPAKEKTRGGLYIPDQAKEEAVEGEVLAVGPGDLTAHGILNPVGCKPGDRVLFGKYVGTKVGEREELVLVHESHVIAVVVAAA